MRLVHYFPYYSESQSVKLKVLSSEGAPTWSESFPVDTIDAIELNSGDFRLVVNQERFNNAETGDVLTRMVIIKPAFVVSSMTTTSNMLPLLSIFLTKMYLIISHDLNANNMSY